MEKKIITDVKSIMGGKCSAVEFSDGTKASCWADKIDIGVLMQNLKSEVMAELRAYDKNGKQGFNLISITPLDPELAQAITTAQIPEAKPIKKVASTNDSIVIQVCLKEAVKMVLADIGFTLEGAMSECVSKYKQGLKELDE